MFNFLCKITFHHCRRFAAHVSLNHEHHFVQFHLLSSSAKKSVKSKLKSCNEQSFTVSYLINSCGLSQERALSASKRVNFETPEKADSIIAFLKNYGFSNSQIPVLIRKHPRVLVCDPNETLTPKIEFFHSLGLSSLDITRLLTKSQNLLTANSEALVIPSFNTLNSYFSSQEDTLFCVKRYPDMLARDFQTKVEVTMEILREAGVPESNILAMLKRQPRVFLTSSDKVKESLEEIKRMGFNPYKNIFLNAAYVMLAMKRLKWKDKMEVYKGWGFSEDAVLDAYRKNPWCMAASKKQIEGILEFFVHRVGYDPLRLLINPVMFSLSLKRRIIPRYSVYQILLSKGLVKRKKLCLSIFKYPKKYFLEKFVECYHKEAPELLNLYQRLISK